ncbi:MAG: hypothetical protein MOB07_09430 [Acidobacteria bacterium]|nr:hypothetical protein [Acidobacteriota bacterium]
MNPDLSTHNDDEPFPRSLVIRYEPHPDGEGVTIWRVTHDGRSETVSYILRYDGKYYPHPLQGEHADSICARKLDDGSIEVLSKKDGKIVSQKIRRLSADGKQITIQVKFLSKTEKWIKRVIVFDKQ